MHRAVAMARWRTAAGDLDVKFLQGASAPKRDDTPMLNRDLKETEMPSPKSRRPNERIKRKYLDFQRLALGRSDASISATAEALHRF